MVIWLPVATNHTGWMIVTPKSLQCAMQLHNLGAIMFADVGTFICEYQLSAAGNGAEIRKV